MRLVFAFNDMKAVCWAQCLSWEGVASPEPQEENESRDIGGMGEEK